MFSQTAYVACVLLIMCWLFVSDRLRMDVVGFLTLTALVLGGVLSVPEALAGFSDPTVHMIAGLFVVGGAIFETGLADRIGTALERLASGSPKKLLAALLVVTAGFSAFLSSTGTVAVMIPVAATLARRSNTSASLFMMPLAYTTLLGGLLTLIATPPNIIVSNALAQHGHEPFGFFDFTGPGLFLLAIGLAYILLLARRLLPQRTAASGGTKLPSPKEIYGRYGLGDQLYELEVLADSPLVGRTIAESNIRSRHSLVVLAVRARDQRGAARRHGRLERMRQTRSGGQHAPLAERAHADSIVRAHDHLTVQGAPEAVEAFVESMKLRERSRPTSLPAEQVIAEVLIPPDSTLVGKTIAETRLRSRFDVHVIAVFRSSSIVSESVSQTTVSVGDLLLLLGSTRSLRKLRDERGEVVFVRETEQLAAGDFRTTRAPHAVLVLLAMLVVMALEVVPPVLAVICAALAAVLLGCVNPREADKHIKWESVLLLAAILPLSTALTKTGIIDLVVEGMVSMIGPSSPYIALSALFILTVLVGVVISNTATAVLIAPIAIQVAGSLQLAPEPLLMTVAVASSAAFLTPVSSPVNMLVMNAGGYKFGDFARFGAPLLLLTWLGALLLVPLFFPFASK